MQITHLGHSTVLLEVAGSRLLIDPGNLSASWHGLTDLDAVLITHLHPDHVDPEHLPTLLAHNPDTRLITEPSVPDTVDLGVDERRVTRLSAGTDTTVGALQVAAVGGEHAVIHRDIPMIGNIGLLVSAESEPTFFHPGDSLAAVPSGVDLLALPAHGPWAAMKEHIDFVRAVGAEVAFPIHDTLLSERGRAMVLGRYADMSETRIDDLADQQPVSF